MKITGQKSDFKRIQVSIQIRDDVLKKIDKIAEDYSVARQRVIELILKEALDNPSFSIKLP